MEGERAIDNRSSLERVWRAAHFEKKLSKSQIYSHDIKDSVCAIKSSGTQYSLRVHAFLLLGLAKILGKKCYLAAEDIEDILAQLTEPRNPAENIKNPLIEVPEKLKLAPLQATEELTLKAVELMDSKGRSQQSTEGISLSEPPRQSDLLALIDHANDILLDSPNFLDDLEMAEK